MKDLIIVGGGAAGLMCAIRAAQSGLQPIVLERTEHVGKKLLATGNGRCNLMNEGPLCFAHGQDFAEAVLGTVPAARQKAIWQELGLYTALERDGRVYPVTGQASTVLDTLRFAAERLHVRVRTDCSVMGIEQRPNGWRLQTSQGILETKQLVLAGGGKAQSRLGSDGSLLRQAEAVGLPVSPLQPGLVGLMTDKRPIAGLEGVRVHAGITLTDAAGRALYTEHGEIIFAADGISGVCVMNASSFWNGAGVLHINFLAAAGMPTADELRKLLAQRRIDWAEEPAEHILNGILLPRLTWAVLRAAKLHLEERSLSSLQDKELDQLCACMADFPLPIKGLRDFDRAQITVGGIDPASISAETLEAKRFPGLYVLGEMLDVDGLCGGFNLMFAFACGVLCAEAIAKGEHT